ncbi:hypothetical protein ACQY0O_003406 [Thecaphora frezii]
MRKARVFSHEVVMPRMSWSPKNLYNLIARSTVPFHASQTSFTKTSLTMYQQRWRSKRFLRAYHGDWIPEKRFKRWFLPSELPRFEPPQVAAASTAGSSTGPRMGGAFDRALKLRRSVQGAKNDATAVHSERMPTASLFMRDVERRLDVVVFRCCFARSAYEARALVVQGKVSLNGQKCTDPNVQLNPGDLISIEPEAVPMLSKEMEKKALKELAAEVATGKGLAAVDELEVEAKELSEEQSADAPAVAAAEEASAEASQGDKGAVAASTEEAVSTDKSTDKGKGKAKSPAQPKVLPPGVRPFHLPAYAAPFLFIPPYLETSFATCSAIYVRHPTITAHRDAETSRWTYRTDLPSPYPAGGELYSMAWELYVRNSPRVRGEARRTKLLGRVGRDGFASARALDADRKRVALRRGWGRTKEVRGWRRMVDAARVSVVGKGKVKAKGGANAPKPTVKPAKQAKPIKPVAKKA